jgi:riboflavin biosynthesis pyrimidine reductase
MIVIGGANTASSACRTMTLAASAPGLLATANQKSSSMWISGHAAQQNPHLQNPHLRAEGIRGYVLMGA